MSSSHAIRARAKRDFGMFSFAILALGTAAYAQDTDANLGTANGWQHYDWLGPANSSSGSGKWTTTDEQPPLSDPFAVANDDALWQEKVGVTYTQPLLDTLSLSYQTDEVTLNEQSSTYSSSTDDTLDSFSHEQSGGLQFQPFEQLKLTGNIHDAMDDAGSPNDSTETQGAGATAEAKLPLSAVLTLGANASNAVTPGDATTTDDSYDLQLKKPLGKSPLTAVLKGHYEETSSNGAPVTRLPSLEQSLVWKAGEETTVQMGLRQQHYQDFPGVTNELNEAIFADWSQTLVPEITWHSYAEVLDSRGTQDVAPAAPATTGTNGSPQSADPTNNVALPTSLSDETLTLSTGPSFKLDRDVSASVEYSNRIDRNPAPGEVQQEQRLSVSLKGTF